MALDEAITLKKLEVFLAYMKHNNMARVSEELSQSTVSVHRALHSLEETMRCALFKRQGRNLIPLQSAYILQEYAKRMMHECEEGVQKARESAGFNPSRLKIGSLYSLTYRCIPQLLISLKLRKPALDIDLTLGSNKELLHQLSDGKLDAVVIGLHEHHNHQIEPDDLLVVPLFNDDIFLAAPLDSPYNGMQKIDLRDVQQEKFITLPDGFVTSQDFTLCFQRAGFLPEVVMHVPDIFSLINLVGGGMGYSVLPGRIGEFSSRVKLISLESKYAAKQMITLLFSKKRERDPNLLALAAECRVYGRRDVKGNRIL